MISRNCVILTGKIATPPRRHYRPDGSPVVQFPLELNKENHLPGQGQPQGDRRPALNHTGSGSLIHVVAFGELAESKFDLLQSGLHLMVVGQLNQRRWQTPEGKKRTRTEVIATDLQKVEDAKETACLPINKIG